MIKNYFTNKYGTFNVDRIIIWSREEKINVQFVRVIDFYHYMFLPTWCEEASLQKNIDFLCSSAEHKLRVTQANLDHPIIVVKDTFELIDGMHRIFKAYFTNVKILPAVFIDRNSLEKFKVTRGSSA